MALAQLATEKQFPGIAYHVLIADNWAPIKDRELIGQLTKPVRVVLCGVWNDDINVDYLNLARKTGGSIHLIEYDLPDPGSMPQGAILRIGNKKYKVENGLFRELNTSEKKGLEEFFRRKFLGFFPETKTIGFVGRYLVSKLVCKSGASIFQY